MCIFVFTATLRVIDNIGTSSLSHSQTNEPTHPRATISAKELLSFTRVQHQVKKAATVAFVIDAESMDNDEKEQGQEQQGCDDGNGEDTQNAKVMFLSFRFKGVALRDNQKKKSS